MRAIRDYIAADSPEAAARTLSAIFQKSEQLRSFPEAGPVAGKWGRRPYRELVAGSHRLIYEIQGSTVFVLGVLHGRQDFAAAIPRWRKP
ncbi:MAG: type II toxin-antitoxin system RelE/ParE family toxin [Candidatus Koribacter versatilis]|uniref:Type II toxin-antitoxin system RelE/ParE family toxin n=1 Tax=Candidatus Korobacter versatilis TaxID=658062 RepID=A0A932A7W4_9BACT|nr:type II toxin-antitoxin system RelE/ParE family toxin [Candidatus Koribacter versatilis]